MVTAKKPASLIVDDHPIHEAKIVKNYLNSRAGKFELSYLPSYSQHLNPDETG